MNTLFHFPLFALLIAIFTGCASHQPKPSTNGDDKVIIVGARIKINIPPAKKVLPGKVVDFNDLPTQTATNFQVTVHNGEQVAIVNVPGYEEPFLIHWPLKIKGDK